ncbi:MAG: 4-(cytidine 5'-diphospho)-2-C-methyl-D-erythritol kinase [Chloroflexi bacterium]|nr:4-(cytidine 5'-diphospho)-2-C-methyl-D-erythritol kinase [Chloroflexota bacterium]MCY3938229.1 4-(cytidine 5'-diphospho)-2-C-methyl-D-erythritol kinase [Chloroflexota bacterium]
MTETLTLKSFAKINLGLEVLGKRPDGYHELISVMQSISLHDVLTISKSTDITVDGDVPRDLPEGDLVRQAADLLGETIGIAQGAHLNLRKAIPIGAGLGGGSSNAACALLGLNLLWGAALTLDELTALAAELGSDVAFFLRGGTALARGRGHEMSALPESPRHEVVIAMPDQSLSTARVYDSVRPHHFSDGTATLALAEGIRDGPLLYSRIRNSLQAPAVRLLGGINGLIAELRRLGAKASIVSGSGSACFGLFAEHEPARRAAAVLAAAGYWSRTCTFVRAWNGRPPLA